MTVAEIAPGSISAGAAEGRELARKRDAVLLPLNFQLPEIQDIAHRTGDSLALSRIAAASQASTIMFCGVHLMAETAKIHARVKILSTGGMLDAARTSRAKKMLVATGVGMLHQLGLVRRRSTSTPSTTARPAA